MHHKFYKIFVVAVIIAVALSTTILPVQAALSYSVSWIGNNFPGHNGNWVQSQVMDAYVTSNGTVYTNSVWDEGGREAGIYKDGQIVVNPAHTHGWGYLGGGAVAVNSQYLFFAQRVDNENGGLNAWLPGNTSWPPNGYLWFGVTRRTLANPTVGAPFTGGKGGEGDTLARSFLVVEQVPQDNATKPSDVARITGLAATATKLYVSDLTAGLVRIYDPNSMAALGSFNLASPGKIAIDQKGNLWIIQTSTGYIYNFKADGTPLSSNTVTDAGTPTALAISTSNELMVGDSGARQQILFYNIKNKPMMSRTFGAAGGIYSGTSGAIADTKLSAPTGIGMDSFGNTYAAGSFSGTDIRKFSLTGQLVWSLRGLEFLDTAIADSATDGADVYTKEEHFTMNYAASGGQESKWNSITANLKLYPQDQRLSNSGAANAVALRNFGGHKYLFTTDQCSDYLNIYRFNGNTAVPAGAMVPIYFDPVYLPGTNLPVNNQSYIWRDSNGDGQIQTSELVTSGLESSRGWGWDVNSTGNIWQTEEGADGVRKFTLQGIDSQGNPIYDRAHMTVFGIPAPFTKVERVKYLAETDTLYLSGYTTDHPQASNEADFGLAGTEIARYNNWSTGNRTASMRIVLPYSPDGRYVKSIAVAGQKVFAGMMRTNTTEGVNVYDANTGLQLTVLIPASLGPTPPAWIDGTEMVNAYRRANGEYLVFVEDNLFAKVLMYRFTDPTEK